jgi:hypothetical protein
MPHKHYTVEDGYKRLGVTPQQVRDVPQVTHHLRRLCKAIKVQDVSIPRDPLYYLRASDDPLVRRVLQARDEIPFGYARLLPWEAFCVKAEVPTPRLVQAMTDVCKIMSRQFATIIAAVAHPAVVEKTVEIALTDEGQKDREMLHRHAGFIQLPSAHQPVSVTVTQHANAQANAEAKAATVLAPTPETTVRRLADRLNAIRGLPPAREITALPASSAEPMPQEIMARASIPATLIPAGDSGIDELIEDEP